MAHGILIDEPSLEEFIQNSIYQSSQFETGANLAKVLLGDKTVEFVSKRIVPAWGKHALYLLNSRMPSGYLLINSEIFTSFPQLPHTLPTPDQVLQIFQRICRLATKRWNNFPLSASESWMRDSEIGIVFPFPIFQYTNFRVAIKQGYRDQRIEKRHGKKILFAFAGNRSDNISPDSNHLSLYSRSFEELIQIRMKVQDKIEQTDKTPTDFGSHSLILAEEIKKPIRYQDFDKWINRLTAIQKRFVTSEEKGPFRIEGPAGTGKTLCLILRAWQLCVRAESHGEECRVLFVSHSDETKTAISFVFDVLGEAKFHSRNKEMFLQTIELCTLQQWCGSLLGPKEITNSQYLDQDALSAKKLRQQFLLDLLKTRLNEDKRSLEYLSPQCKSFFIDENLEYTGEILQHEVGVMIKGRAGQDLDKYLELPKLAYGLPAYSQNDRRFIFSIYRRYQEFLNDMGVYDTDDIVLSALGKLDTPIWRRRRIKEGFDFVIIDETHLFNLNELALFHHVLRQSGQPAIAFSIDRSQAPGERGITTRMVREILTGNPDKDLEINTSVVFRSSPQIVRLAEAITAEGASLFTTFENPLINVSSVITSVDETKTVDPVIWKCPNDEQMIDFAIARVFELCKTIGGRRSDFLLVATNEDLLTLMRKILSESKEGYVEILQRGDLETVEKGSRGNQYIISHPDFVGGLEFKGVFILGVDEGRVPPTANSVTAESKHFLSFKSCNRLYVSVTRARLVVELFYSSERGVSNLLASALDSEVLIEKSLLKP